MRVGVSYLAPHNPKHIRADLEEIAALGCNDVLLAFQENDAVYFPGKISQLPALARALGVRPIAIFWGALNFFGGGRSSQFLLADPAAHQVRRDGGWHEGGCYNNPRCLAKVEELIEQVAAAGFAGFFVDEPSPMDCFCASCLELHRAWSGSDLRNAAPAEERAFRHRSVIHYIERVTSHIKKHHPTLATMCCMMPSDRSMWREVAGVRALDALGTDLYWANEDRDLEEMRPFVRELAALCKANGKLHQEWFQCWGVRRGREERAAAQARILLEEKPDALYTWAFNAQLGTSEACEDPARAWQLAGEVLRAAAMR